MKRLCGFLALVLALALTAFTTLAEEADQLATIQSKGEIVVATEGAWAPWTYHDEQNNLVGFDVEVAQAIAGKLGVTATFAETEWDGIFAGLDAGRYDIAANGVEITEERAQKYDFTVPYGYIRTALVVRGDNEDIASFEDLAGKHTANSIASTYMTLAESYGASAVGVDTLDQTLEMVLSGRADATLNAEVSFYDYMSVHPDANLKVVALTDTASQVAIPLRKGTQSTSLLTAINQAIDELASEGELAQISEKYFGKDMTRADIEKSEGDENMLEHSALQMNVQVGDSSFTATLEDNEAARTFAAMMADAPVSISMNDYSGFEKVGPLGASLPAGNAQMTTKAGDIVLYNSDQIVAFYGSNSWSYTKLGEIDDLSGWSAALGSGDVTITFSLAD